MDAPGSTARLTAQVLDRNEQRMTEAAVAWSSNSAVVAAVNSTGLVTAVADGTATVTATVGGASGTVAVTVARPRTGGAATDRAALLAFFNATDGPNWVNNENWLTDAPLEDWVGVATNAEGPVVGLEMAYWDWDAEQWVSNNVSGPLPPEFGELSSLERVWFYKNNLSGPIPRELGKLTQLTSLDFDANDSSGPIRPN
ncbi:MAG: Ig-like domain-containing protein [bacterium]|nr:Ig-like domain-containing protein [bacterium]